MNKEARITITPPNMEVFQCKVVGTAPYVQNKFGKKAKEKMRNGQLEGSVGKKGKKREPRDFQADYEESMHRDDQGRFGIPATAFRNAMIDACRMVGYKMTYAKLSVFIDEDAFDPEDGTPLVWFTKGEPEYSEMATRVGQGTTQLAARGMWREGWEAVLRVKYDADQFTSEDVANLLVRAGLGGIGAGRPFSKQSAGLGFGTFEIASA